MNILVVGSGGREHAVIKKLRENSEVKKIYALPGNGGIAAAAECVNIGARDIAGIAEFASTKFLTARRTRSPISTPHPCLQS